MRKRLEKVVLDEYYSKCEEEGKSPKGSDLEQEDFEAPDENVDMNALDEGEETASEEEIEEDIEDVEGVEDDEELEEETEEDLL